MTRFVLDRFVREGDYYNGDAVATFNSKEEALKALPTEEDIIEEIRKENIAQNRILSKCKSNHRNDFWGYEITMETLDEDGEATDWESIGSIEVSVYEVLCKF